MERMSAYQETAFDKLYRWTQTETRTFGRELLEVPITMIKALKALKQRPVLFQYVQYLLHIFLKNFFMFLNFFFHFT